MNLVGNLIWLIFGGFITAAGYILGGLALLFDLIWILLFGWEIAIAHLVAAGILAITIVGLPFARQHIKLIPVAIFPFQRDLR